MPKKNSETAITGTEAAMRATAIPTPAAAATAPAVRTVLAVPIRPTTQPAVGSASREPTAVQSRRLPICPDVRLSASVTAGMRAAQLAKTSPFMPKTKNVAIAAAFTLGTVRVLVVMQSQLPQRVR